MVSRSCDDLSEFIEYSTGELGDDTLDTNDAEDMEPEPPISDEVRSENEFRRKSCDEDVMGTITFPQEQPALMGAIATQEEECSFDSNITFDETTEVETTDNTLDYTTVPNDDYEVHIDLSDSAFIKSIPLKVRKQNSFKCDICGAAFVQAINLQKHMQKTHVPDKYFTCSVCNHWFSLEVELFKHAKYCKEAETDEDHTDSNEHDIKRLVKSANVPIESHRRCVYCERDFQTPFALRMHLRTHTGERPFPCKFCDKSFKTQSSLNAHLKR